MNPHQIVGPVGSEDLANPLVITLQPGSWLDMGQIGFSLTLKGGGLEHIDFCSSTARVDVDTITDEGFVDSNLPAAMCLLHECLSFIRLS